MFTYQKSEKNQISSNVDIAAPSQVKIQYQTSHRAAITRYTREGSKFKGPKTGGHRGAISHPESMDSYPIP